MSLEKIQLRKVLRLMYAPAAKRTALLREDIRNELNKSTVDDDADGADFFGPFWADAKKHVAGTCDLHTATVDRIQKNKRRKRLYELSEKGFLNWWNEKRRWKNEPFVPIPKPVKKQLPIPEINGVVRIENLLALKIGDGSNRIIYPYFFEIPALPKEGQRIGLSILHKALPEWGSESLRILDILRSASAGTADINLTGDEYELFIKQYKMLLADWKTLYSEYV